MQAFLCAQPACDVRARPRSRRTVELTNQQDAPAPGLRVGPGAGPAREHALALSTGHRGWGWAWPGVSTVFQFCFYKEWGIDRLSRERE